jgi:hypothetical protein
MRRVFEQLRELHPDAKYVHGYRMSGARAKEGGGEQEMWLELTDKGAKLLREDPRSAADVAAAEAAPLDLGEKVDPAIADRQRQEVALKAGSPLQATCRSERRDRPRPVRSRTISSRSSSTRKPSRCSRSSRPTTRRIA